MSQELSDTITYKGVRLSEVPDMAAQISALRQEIAVLETQLGTSRRFTDYYGQQCDTLKREKEALLPFMELIRDASLPEQWEIDHPAMRYVTIQVDKDDWKAAREALDSVIKEKG